MNYIGAFCIGFLVAFVLIGTTAKVNCNAPEPFQLQCSGNPVSSTLHPDGTLTCDYIAPTDKYGKAIRHETSATKEAQKR